MRCRAVRCRTRPTASIRRWTLASWPRPPPPYGCGFMCPPGWYAPASGITPGGTTVSCCQTQADGRDVRRWPAEYPEPVSGGTCVMPPVGIGSSGGGVAYPTDIRPAGRRGVSNGPNVPVTEDGATTRRRGRSLRLRGRREPVPDWLRRRPSPASARRAPRGGAPTRSIRCSAARPRRTACRKCSRRRPARWRRVRHRGRWREYGADAGCRGRWRRERSAARADHRWGTTSTSAGVGCSGTAGSCSCQNDANGHVYVMDCSPFRLERIHDLLLRDGWKRHVAVHAEQRL